MEIPAPPAPYAVDAACARRNAAAAARTYLNAARLELEVGTRMLERLDYVKLSPERMLDAGSGPSPQADGLFKRYPKAHLVALDFSLEMLHQVESTGFLQRMIGRARQTGVCAELGRLPLRSRSMGLVWSNMALHWAPNIETALAEFHRVLEVEGLMMFSTLGPDTLKELRSASSTIPGAPHVHRFIDMHDLGDMLVGAGFAAPVMDTETITLTYADLPSMVRDLRETGQTCALESRSRGLMGPRNWRRFEAALKTGLQDGRLPATIEVVYGHAWKAPSRRTAEGHAIVKLPIDSRSRK